MSEERLWKIAKEYAPRYGIPPEHLYEFLLILKVYIKKVIEKYRN